MNVHEYQVPVRRHDFNSAWLGREFGISEDSNLLRLSESELLQLTSDFEIVEVKVRSPDAPPIVGAPGIIRHVDTQISYSVPTLRGSDLLVRLGAKTSVENLVSRDVTGENWQPFESERFIKIKGVSESLLASRYVTWARNLTQSNPELCGRVTKDDLPVGDFFGSVVDGRLSFALAVTDIDLHSPATLLYAAALDFFHRIGFSKISASFSASNLGAINVHSQLQCRFTQTTEIYFIEVN